jgi:Tol biopolymer transport system component
LAGVAVILIAAAGTRDIGHSDVAVVSAARSPSHGCLVFSAGNSRQDIYLIYQDGTGLRRLTSGVGNNFSPTWSYDGRQIAFRSEREGKDSRIFLMDADGGSEHEWRLPGHPEGLTWSPNGRRLAYSGGATDDEQTSGDIYVVDSGGGTPHRVSGRPGYTNEFPSWSRDSAWLTYASTRGARGDDRALWLVKVDGTRRRMLTPAGRHSTWTADGTRIVFASLRGARGDRRRLWILTLKKSTPRRFGAVGGEFPKWSPSGKILAFSAYPGGLGLLDRNGRLIRRIAGRLGFVGWPAWRPGGCVR